MREPPPKQSKSDARRIGEPPSKRSVHKTGNYPAEFQSRLDRFKKAVVTRLRDTGVRELDEANLIEEMYTLIMVMHIFTKQGGPWHNKDSPDWPRRSLRVMEEMEVNWL